MDRINGLIDISITVTKRRKVHVFLLIVTILGKFIVTCLKNKMC